jgi:hypothetical protein
MYLKFKKKDENNDSFNQGKSNIIRQLTDSEKAKLSKDTQLVNEFKQNKIELEAKK